MKRSWMIVITHLLAFAIGWMVMRGHDAKVASSESSGSNATRATGSVKPGATHSGNPWLQATAEDYRVAWDEMLRKPRNFHAPGGALASDFALAESNFLRMWARVDTAAALKGLGDLRLNLAPLEVLEDLMLECGTENPEPYFKQVPGMHNLPILKTVPMLAKLAVQVAATDPERACSLVSSMPAGEMRGMVLTKMLGALDDRAFRIVADRISGPESGSSSHTEITMVHTALEKQINRRKMQENR